MWNQGFTRQVHECTGGIQPIYPSYYQAYRPMYVCGVPCPTNQGLFYQNLFLLWQFINPPIQPQLTIFRHATSTIFIPISDVVRSIYNTTAIGIRSLVLFIDILLLRRPPNTKKQGTMFLNCFTYSTGYCDITWTDDVFNLFGLKIELIWAHKNEKMIAISDKRDLLTWQRGASLMGSRTSYCTRIDSMSRNPNTFSVSFAIVIHGNNDSVPIITHHGMFVIIRNDLIITIPFIRIDG